MALIFIVLMVPAVVIAGPGRVLTVRQALDTAHFMEAGGTATSADANWVRLAPDGGHYVVRLLQGDVGRNGDWMTVLVGGTQSLAAARPQVVWRAFTHAYDHPWHQRELMEGEGNPIIWVDNQNVAFRWDDQRGIVQVLEVNIRTHVARYLSHCATDVALFKISNDRTMVMACDAPSASAGKDDRNRGPFGGHYVTTTDGMLAGQGDLAGRNVLDEVWDRDLYLVNLQSGAQRRIAVTIRAEQGPGTWPFSPRLSPNGRYELVDAWAGRLDPAWRAYGKGKDLLSVFVRAELASEKSWLGRDLTKLYLVDVRTGTTRPFWDAPTFQLPSRVKVAWAPDSEELVAGPAVLPLADSDETRAGRPALVTVNVRNGKISRLPVSRQTLSELTRLAWPRADTIEAKTRRDDLLFQRIGAHWRFRGSLPLPHAPEVTVRLEMKGGLDAPPALYAIDLKSRKQKLILDPNPGLQTRFGLGRVRYLHWSYAGRRMPANGTLYYPPQYRRGRRYPLVIQICPASSPGERGRFSLYGCDAYPGLGPSPAIYAARMLAARGMFVLDVEDHAPGMANLADVRMYAAGARKLSAEGLVDAARVGIAGHSKPGYLAEEAVTYSDYQYAAAISSASFDTGYFDRILEPDATETPRIKVSGRDLSWFLDRSPTFSADRIRAALLLVDDETPGIGILWKWELYAQLRALHAPVEYYVIPDVVRGSHLIANPGQLIAMKETAVDWFDFWLNGHEDLMPQKAPQYEYWKRLRAQRDALARLPRPPLLKWVPSPVEEKSAARAEASR